MKRILYVSILLLIFLSACDSGGKNEGDATIQDATLSEFEEGLLDLVGQQSFVHDIEIHNEEAEELTLRVDYYEDGEHIDEIIVLSTDLSELDKEEKIRTIFLREEISTEDERWITSIITENGMSSAANEYENKNAEELDFSAWGHATDPTVLDLGEQKVIAQIISTSKSAISVRDTGNAEEMIERTKDYEQVYLLSIILE